jgi:hypothetical protein
VDLDADPDTTFHFDADPDPGLGPTPTFKNVEKSDFFSFFIHSSVPVPLSGNLQ